MRYAWLCHPVTVAGVLLLLINDHLLKPAFPGVVTGKLSDVAGLVMAPALVAVLLTRPAAALAARLRAAFPRAERRARTAGRPSEADRRSRAFRFGRPDSWSRQPGPWSRQPGPWSKRPGAKPELRWLRSDVTAVVLTGTLFTLVKTTEAGAETASQVWTFLAGPSRVLADPTDLLALPALVISWWARNHSLRRPPAARWRVVVTMPLAMVAVTATSAMPVHSYASDVTVDDRGRLLVQTSAGSSYVSEDGGITWSLDSFTQEGKKGQSAQCVPKQATRCYRVTDHRTGVDQSDDGGTTWRPSWRPSADDIKRLRRLYEDSTDLVTTLAVQERPGGHVVVAASGPDMVLVRDTSGTWRHVPLDGDLPAVPLTTELLWAWLLAACTLLGFVGAGLRRLVRSYLCVAAVTYAGFAAFVTFKVDPSSGPSDEVVGMIMAMGGLYVTLIGGASCLGLAAGGRARALPVSVGLLGAPLVFASIWTPFQAWSSGALASYEVATALAALLASAVLVTSVLLVRRAARDTVPADVLVQPATGEPNPLTWHDAQDAETPGPHVRRDTTPTEGQGS